MTESSGARRVLSLDDIPSAPANDPALLALLDDDNAEIRAIAAAIERHPTLTAAIIAVANSAYFRAVGPVYSVEDSIIKVLGLRLVRAMAASLLMTATLDVSACRSFSLVRFWTRALATANLAQQLARRVDDAGVGQEAAYLAGLLHEIGRLLLAHVFKDRFSVLMGRGGSPTELERASLGIEHTRAGELMARRWGLPEPVPAVCRGYRDPHYHGPFESAVLLVGLSRTYVKTLEQDEAGGEGADFLIRHARLGLGTSGVKDELERFAGHYLELERVARQLAASP